MIRKLGFIGCAPGESDFPGAFPREDGSWKVPGFPVEGGERPVFGVLDKNTDNLYNIIGLQEMETISIPEDTQQARERRKDPGCLF